MRDQWGNKMKDWKSKFRKYTGHECFVDGDKHNFKPRYEEADLVNLEKDSLDSPFLETICTLNRKYICDVCEWCGKVINTQKNESKPNK